MNNLLTDITAKRQKLEELKTHLKAKFFGIDDQIDLIVSSMETWYFMPSIITHPIIVNLWSLTGNGKTDLVRSVVNFLEYNNRFCEIQLSDTVSTTGTEDTKSNMIASQVLRSGCRENEPGIILLDEFQRYRTVKGFGEDVPNLPYQDIWMLLSDGKFPVDPKRNKVFRELSRDLGFEWRCVEYDDDGNITSSKPLSDIDEDEYDKFEVNSTKYKAKRVPKSQTDFLLLPRANDRSFSQHESYLIERVQSFLDFSVSYEDIANSTYLRVYEQIKKYHSNRTSTYDFTKSLIFVCGNLDEAFQVADNVDDCDTDADIFHNYTKKVSIIEIKKALSCRFKPEQISRLGNNHVIYPSLTKDAYKKIIQRTCLEYLKKASEISKVNFTLHDSVRDEIYDNAVFPTQGTRPVFSSIHMMFGAPLSHGVLWALTNEYKHITIKISPASSCLTFVADNGEEKCVPIQFQLRDRRNRHSANFSALVSVHEVGHAILHTFLFKDAPADIKINVASFDGGYNRYDFKYTCAKDVRDKICVTLGGIAAEELIFGAEHRSTGAASDLNSATQAASRFVRRYAMDNTISVLVKDDEASFNHDLTESNHRIEQILKEEKRRACEIMAKHKDFLIQCSKDLLDRKSFSKAEFMEYGKGIFDFSKNTQPTDKVDTNSPYYEMLMSA